MFALPIARLIKPVMVGRLLFCAEKDLAQGWNVLVEMEHILGIEFGFERL